MYKVSKEWNNVSVLNLPVSIYFLSKDIFLQWMLCSSGITDFPFALLLKIFSVNVKTEI